MRTPFCAWTTVVLLSTIARKRSLPPSPGVTHYTYGCQNSHERQLANSSFRIFNLHKHDSVCSTLTGSITPFHLLFTPLSTNSLFTFWKKKSYYVTGDRDSISRTSLFESFLMMCRSTSDLSLKVWMQFFPNYLIILTWHLASYPKFCRGDISVGFMWLVILLVRSQGISPNIRIFSCILWLWCLLFTTIPWFYAPNYPL